MSTTPLPIDQFAKRVRDKYPGAYDKLSDADLVNRVVTKYPQYKDNVASYAETQFEKDREPDAEGSGFLSHVGQSLRSMIPDPPKTMGEAVKSGLTASTAMLSPLMNAGREAAAAHERGHGLPYSAAAGASTLVGVSPERMEQAAEKGDTAGIWGEAAVPAMMAVSPLMGEELHVWDRQLKAGQLPSCVSLPRRASRRWASPERSDRFCLRVCKSG